jgi:hypothetical protein
MTSSISAPIHAAAGSYSPLAKPYISSERETDEIEHPFADFDPQYEGVTILRSEAEKVWSDDQSKDLFGKDGFTFEDFLDIINPLQHIPVVATIYRSISGDEIEPGSRIAGGALFGGGLGLAGALVNAVIEDSTGKDLGDHALAMFTGETSGNQIDIEHVAVMQAPASKAISSTNATVLSAAIKSPTLNTAHDPNNTKSNNSKPFDRAPAVKVNSARGQAFGGIMMPPNGKAPLAQTNKAAATEALLQARSAVPAAGVSGISGRSSVNRIVHGVGPKTTGHHDVGLAVNSKDPITLSPSVDAQLNRLSQRSAAKNINRPTQQPNQKNVLPTEFQKPGDGTNKFNNVTAFAPLPNVMLDALDKYELMVRERRQKNS